MARRNIAMTEDEIVAEVAANPDFAGREFVAATFLRPIDNGKFN